MVKRYRIYIAVGVVVALLAAYIFLVTREEAPIVPADWGQVTEGGERVIPEGYVEYRGDAYGFSIAYPEELARKEFDEGGGATTILFGAKDRSKGFQVFVVPYGAEQIDKERFLTDVPSGEMNEPIDVLIDGVRATAFFSHNSVMGDTREVWFIKNGFLFEVTTYKEQDAWLAEIMRGWRWNT